MNDTRFNRLESRVEKLDDKIDGIKEDIGELKVDIRVFQEKVESHVAGDDKIIQTIVPTLHQFKSFVENDLSSIKYIVEVHKAKELTEKLREEKKKKIKSSLGIASVVVSLVTGVVYKLFQMGIIKF